MKRRLFVSIGLLAIVGLVGLANLPAAGTEADDASSILNAENKASGIKLSAIPIVDDLTFLRRIYVDIIGRIPTNSEMREFVAMPSSTRRSQIIDELIADERFVDTWTTFYADMLRLRYRADGGAATLAYVHKALEDGMPHDELSHRLISASGKAGANPEIGYILGSNADAMALAGATAQIFMGLRVACAECHDHPFDKWTRKEFYGFAAFFGKTRRIETQFTNSVYTTEVNQTTVLWPPQGDGEASDRKPVAPAFLFALDKKDGPRKHVARLASLRQKQTELLAQKNKKSANAGIDDLLAAAGEKADKKSNGSLSQGLGVVAEAKKEARNLDIRGSVYRKSKLRMELADVVTSPYNHYFSRSFVNRVWAQLVGRGFVEPIDDLSDENKPSHPKTLAFLADEFVANGYDLKTLVRMIVSSEAYQRGHATGVDELTQTELEAAFLATPMRRMMSEALYDSIVVAGHLFEVKHMAGKNMKVVWRESRIEKKKSGASKNDEIKTNNLAATDDEKKAKMAKMKAKELAQVSSYNLEKAISLDFKAILKKAEKKGAETESSDVDKMRVMSKEEIEAMRMAQQMRRRAPGVEYIDRFIKAEIDDNPFFTTSFLMASPANPEHFLRVFGQTDRTQLGIFRDHSPNMRQALMMLNGRLTHEASRVGELEAVFGLLIGPKADLDKAVHLSYREILTREPSADEVAEAKLIIADAVSPTKGMADLRWILLNCNEFKHLR